MMHEHTGSAQQDVHMRFEASNYDMPTTSAVEWYFVKSPFYVDVDKSMVNDGAQLPAEQEALSKLSAQRHSAEFDFKGMPLKIVAKSDAIVERPASQQGS